jgi:hypothetical protein
MDLWVKRMHGVWIVARSQAIPLAPGAFSPSLHLLDRPTPARAPLPNAGLSGSLASRSLRAASNHPRSLRGALKCHFPSAVRLQHLWKRGHSYGA